MQHGRCSRSLATGTGASPAPVLADYSGAGHAVLSNLAARNTAPWGKQSWSGAGSAAPAEDPAPAAAGAQGAPRGGSRDGAGAAAPSRVSGARRPTKAAGQGCETFGPGYGRHGAPCRGTGPPSGLPAGTPGRTGGSGRGAAPSAPPAPARPPRLRPRPGPSQTAPTRDHRPRPAQLPPAPPAPLALPRRPPSRTGPGRQHRAALLLRLTCRKEAPASGQGMGPARRADGRPPAPPAALRPVAARRLRGAARPSGRWGSRVRRAARPPSSAGRAGRVREGRGAPPAGEGSDRGPAARPRPAPKHGPRASPRPQQPAARKAWDAQERSR